MTIIYTTYTPKDGSERGSYFPTLKAAKEAIEAAAIYEVRAAAVGEEKEAYRAVLDSAFHERFPLSNKSEICTALNNESTVANEF